jgi:hypothetical protein
VVTVHRVFRHLTLNRIGTCLFLMSLCLLFASIVEFLVRSVSQGSTTVRFSGLSESESLLLGVASLVLSAIVFGLAIVNERLERIEAKLDSVRKSSEAER